MIIHYRMRVKQVIVYIGLIYLNQVCLILKDNPYFEKISDLIDFASKNWIKFRYSNKYKDSLSFILSNRFAGNRNTSFEP